MDPPTLANLNRWVARCHFDPAAALPYVDTLELLSARTFWKRVAEYEPQDPPPDLWQRFLDPDVPLSQWPIEYTHKAEALAEARIETWLSRSAS